jgi:pyruvate/2-oxoglutarate dehydrogenase complex dihydrolipoamide acyltransferase (E2) component
MKTILQIITITIVLILTIIVDIPILPLELVPEAQAILGVRRRAVRRTAVVVSSADAAALAASQQQAAAAQQQAAAANQEAAAAQQQAATAQATSGVPVGTVAQALPAGCKPVTVSNVEYQDCGGSFYKTAFQGNNLVYVVVKNPIP